MLFDAHNRAFQAFGGVPSRVIYDNMKTAVDRVLRKLRAVNARFEVMCGHYLFEPEFCTVAAGWEKGIVEKNVQDARHRIWVEICERRWEHWGQLNDWLLDRCRSHWQESLHSESPGTATSGGTCSRGQGPKPRQHWGNRQKNPNLIRVGISHFGGPGGN